MRLRIALLMIAGVVGLAVVFDLGPFRSFEDRLKPSVSQSDCAEISTNRHGYYGADTASLREQASEVFVATCEVGGPSVAWYRFPSRRALDAARSGFDADYLHDVCVSEREREILLFRDTDDHQDLCSARGGRITVEASERTFERLGVEQDCAAIPDFSAFVPRIRRGAIARLRGAARRPGVRAHPAFGRAVAQAARRAARVDAAFERFRREGDPTDTIGVGRYLSAIETTQRRLSQAYERIADTADAFGVADCHRPPAVPARPPSQSPDEVELETPPGAATRGKQVATQAGCLACHLIGEAGNDGPGPDITKNGAQLDRGQLNRVLVNPTAPMPSFRTLPDKQREDLLTFLESLR